MEELANKTSLYIDTMDVNAQAIFAEALCALICDESLLYNEIVLLCIGTDRATGDSFGPLVGYKLANELNNTRERIFDVHVYGTLDSPVHAKNIVEVTEDIYYNHMNPLVIAVDASLGIRERVGFLSIGKGSIRPGAGLNKNLPSVGDIFITGIVNSAYSMDICVLQNTRLAVVMKMADIVTNGIISCLEKYTLAVCKSGY